MTPQTTLLFPDGRSAQPLWFKTFPDEEFSTIVRMSNDERGLFTSLRWYAITNGGFLGDWEIVWKEARNFCGISRFKFRKIFPLVLKYFTEVDGVFCFERDEERVSESRSNVAKAKRSAEIAAKARWNGAEKKPAAPTPISDAAAYADQPTTREREIVTGEPPPPPTTTEGLNNMAEVVGGGGSPQTQENKPESPDGTGYEVFVAHCKTNGFSTGSEELWRRLRAKFRNLSPQEICKNLPRFDGQSSAGLWDHHTQLVLIAEADRQANPEPVRKPSRPQGKESLAERIKRL